ncbi:protocadherin Fat 1-like [Saccostrea echinata]|uniref:protocadherin Fat 1-like n=1 Tax=Saccostrea echinata TaxID=191078 RepID=UPI002A7FA0A0|nr:protocadherin Fat 1-like [Saccostrea echinata]
MAAVYLPQLLLTSQLLMSMTTKPECTPKESNITIREDQAIGTTGTGTVTVHVNNENDNAPTCTTSAESLMVSENSVPGDVIVADFGCSDEDNDLLIYTLIQDPADNGFEIVSNQLTVKGTLDYETTTFYSIIVTVSDGSLFTQMKLAINILNENEAAPQFFNKVMSGTVSEDDVVGKSISTVFAVDPDNDDVVYSFVGIYPNFMIDPKKGKITLRSSVDRERQPTIALYVLASDGELSSTATVLVTVLDVNEPPKFGSTNYHFSIVENTSSGGTVGTVSAADADVGATNGQVRYKILSGNDESYFQVESTSVVVTIASPTDYEKFKTALLVIEASDFGSPSLSGICTVIIQILDRNDNTPVFLSSTLQEKVSEDTPLGQWITQVFAFDKDSSENGNNKVSYQSASVVPFQVDSMSGVVTLMGNLDRETILRFQMVILATDDGAPRRTGTLTLEIVVTDVNDNAPAITGSYLTTVSENVPENFVIFNINGSDVDGDSIGKLKYELASSEMNPNFKIEPNTGVLQVASPLDRESVDRYDVIIKVSDNGFPTRSTSVTATINIGDVNDNTPTFSKTFYEFLVQEHAVFNTFLRTITATDDDIGSNSELTYQIATYWKGSIGKFRINEITGDIYTTGVLDREIEDEYRILFRVADDGTPSLSSDVTVKIQISDINDNAPVFQRPEYSTAIFENLATGSKVLQTGALDKDMGDNAAIRYELDISTQDGLRADYYFGVYGETGGIYLKKRVDRETYEKFILTVVARDSGKPSLSTKVNISIQIEDVNDNEPTFSPLFYNTEASDINLCDAIITHITASDSDLGRNAALNFGLDPKDTSSPFSVSQLGVVNRKADLVQSKYIIHVMAHDNGDPVLMSSEQATIRVDRFDPDDVVVTFYFDLAFSSFLQKETNFLLQLEESLRFKYPTAYVRRWCIEEKASFLMVHVYAVKTEITNDINNLYKDKVFLTNGEFLNVLQLDSDDRPTLDVNGKTWNEFSIQKVVPFGNRIVYPGPVISRMAEKDDDIAVPLGVSISLLAVVIIAFAILIYFAWRRRWCRKKKEIDEPKKARVVVTETKRKETDIPLFEKREQSMVSNSAVSMVFPTQLKSSEGQKNDPILDCEQQTNKQDLESSSSSPGVTTKVIQGPYIKFPISERPVFQTTNLTRFSPALSRSKNQSATVSPVPILHSANRTQDNVPTRRGIDIVTGWMYEENPKTKVRNWIRTPSGDNKSAFLGD